MHAHVHVVMMMCVPQVEDWHLAEIMLCLCDAAALLITVLIAGKIIAMLHLVWCIHMLKLIMAWTDSWAGKNNSGAKCRQIGKAWCDKLLLYMIVTVSIFLIIINRCKIWVNRSSAGDWSAVAMTPAFQDYVCSIWWPIVKRCSYLQEGVCIIVWLRSYTLLIMPWLCKGDTV